jgi:hypothetical protein
MGVERADPAGARQLKAGGRQVEQDSLETTKTTDKLVIPSSGREPQPRFVPLD